MTCVGMPSGHPDQDKSCSLNVCSSDGQSTAVLTMLTTHVHTPTHTPTYEAHFIVPSRIHLAGTNKPLNGPGTAATPWPPSHGLHDLLDLVVVKTTGPRHHVIYPFLHFLLPEWVRDLIYTSITGSYHLITSNSI